MQHIQESNSIPSFSDSKKEVFKKFMNVYKYFLHKMTNTDSIIARSNELLLRVRKQIQDGSSYLSDLVNQSQPPASIPFAPTTISLEDVANSVQTAGDHPPEAETTGQPSINDEETQRRLRAFFASRMDMLSSRASVSRISTTDIPTAQPEPDQEAPEENEHEEEEEKDDFGQIEPKETDILVFVDPKTTMNSLSPNEVLSTANIADPIQHDNMPGLAHDDIAEDGFWVPDLPLCKPENVRRIEYRLLWEDPNREQYFGADKAMNLDNPQIVQISPPFPVEPLSHDGHDQNDNKITYAPASVWGLQDIDVTREFYIEVLDVQFTTHFLSCKEDGLTKKIRQLKDAYDKDQNLSRATYYKNKISALRTAWKEVENNPEERDAELKYLNEIHDCRTMQDIEESNSRMIRDDLTKTYQELKEWRSSNFTLSPLFLRWKRRNFSKEEKEEQQAEFDHELNNRVEEELRLAQLNNEDTTEAAIRMEILNNSEQLGLRKPGESLWKPVLEDSAEITPENEIAPSEQQRREQKQQARIFLKFLVNGQERHKSPDYAFNNNDFAVIINNRSSKWLSNIIPYSVTIEIWETGYIKGKRFIASVNLPITVGRPPDFRRFEFSSLMKNSFNELICGTIQARCFINPKLINGQVFIRCPDAPSQKAKNKIAQDPSSFMSIEKLLEWSRDHDPNDPYMAAILSRIIATRKTDSFQLDSNLNATTFASLVPTSIAQQLQQHMEKLRRQDEEARQRLKQQEKQPEESYLKRIKRQGIIEGAQIANEVKLTDVIKEAPLPAVPTIFVWLREFISMYRPLKPIRKPRIGSDKTETYMKLVIRIMHALNVPTRSEFGMGPRTTSSLIHASTNNQSTNLFCRITVNGQEKCTECVSGIDPQWNEAFEFKLCNNQDIKPTLIELSQTSIRIDLFDEVVFNVVNDDREQQTRHEQTEKRIIGYVDISLPALWIKSNIQGTYPVIMPPFQLAYKQTSARPTSLIVFGALNPSLEDEEINAETKSSETEQVILRAQAWIKKIKDMTKPSKDRPRRILLMAAMTNGKTIVACRMVKKQPPPELFEEKQQLLRFVSLIPVENDAAVFETQNQMWCTSAEFLEVNCGDDEEHALLLCNYFKFIGLDAYVLLGYDYINGKTAYVATKEANRVTLYDPMGGFQWSSKDRECPFYSVGMIFNEDNVWANIQEDTAPYTIDWNIHNTRSWYPFFTPDFPKPIFESPQLDVLTYKPTNETESRQIKRELDNAIKNAVESWREHQRTKWDNQLSLRIEQKLEMCEAALASDPNPNFDSFVQDFKDNYQHYRMTGGPFCLSYKSVDDVVEEVKRRETWKTESPNAYFALGVYVAPYPNEVYAVWVMLVFLDYIIDTRTSLV